MTWCIASDSKIFSATTYCSLSWLFLTQLYSSYTAVSVSVKHHHVFLFNHTCEDMPTKPLTLYVLHFFYTQNLCTVAYSKLFQTINGNDNRLPCLSITIMIIIPLNHYSTNSVCLSLPWDEWEKCEGVYGTPSHIHAFWGQMSLWHST